MHLLVYSEIQVRDGSQVKNMIKMASRVSGKIRNLSELYLSVVEEVNEIIVYIHFRVLAPPGGKTSISLFGGDAPAPAEPQRKEVNPCQAARNKSNVFGSDDAGPAVAPNHHREGQQRRQQSSVFGEPSQPVPKPSFEPEPRKPHSVNPHQEKRQQSSVFKEPEQPSKPPPSRKGADVISGRGGQPTEEKQHTSVKVHAPPGGVSHISFG